MMIYISTFSEGLSISIFSVFIVFVILGFIALAIESLKYFQTTEKPIMTPVKKTVQKPLELSDIKDEDMMVAALVASIDYYEEIKKDVRVVSIREIKTNT